jgi:hypothetical protein
LQEVKEPSDAEWSALLASLQNSLTSLKESKTVPREHLDRIFGTSTVVEEVAGDAIAK